MSPSLVPVPIDPRLHPCVWSRLTPQQRLAVLQQLERELARRERRPACLVVMQDLNRNSSKQGYIYHGHFLREDNRIVLDSSLLTNPLPYRAVGTYFHEARHAYQFHRAANPISYPEDVEAPAWQRNGIAYVPYVEAPVLYYWQPVEADARRVERQRLWEVYGQAFRDPGVHDHLSNLEAEERAYAVFGQLTFGQNYREEARKAIDQRYYQMLQQKGLKPLPFGPIKPLLPLAPLIVEPSREPPLEAWLQRFRPPRPKEHWEQFAALPGYERPVNYRGLKLHLRLKPIHTLTSSLIVFVEKPGKGIQMVGEIPMDQKDRFLWDLRLSSFWWSHSSREPAFERQTTGSSPDNPDPCRRRQPLPAPAPPTQSPTTAQKEKPLCQPQKPLEAIWRILQKVPTILPRDLERL